MLVIGVTTTIDEFNKYDYLCICDDISDVYDYIVSKDCGKLHQMPYSKEEKPTVIGGMSRSELDRELMKGVNSIKSGKTYTEEEVNDVFS